MTLKRSFQVKTHSHRESSSEVIQSDPWTRIAIVVHVFWLARGLFVGVWRGLCHHEQVARRCLSPFGKE